MDAEGTDHSGGTSEEVEGLATLAEHLANVRPLVLIIEPWAEYDLWEREQMAAKLEQ